MRIEQISCRFFVVVAILGLVACGKQEPKEPPLPQVNVIVAETTAVPIVSTLTGRTNAYLDAQVRARVDGIVLRRYFVEGSNVRVGQRLYQIDPAPYIAALNNAKASLAKAQANLVSAKALAKRYKVLVAARAVSQQQYDDAVSAQGQAIAEVAAAKAMVETATINLGYTNVVAPISGRIGISDVTPGAYVQAAQATLMATIQQLNPMYVDLTQSSLEGLKLRQDVASGKVKTDGPSAAKVTLYLEDGSIYQEKGRLQFSDVSVNQSTGSVIVRAIFPNNQNLLLPGMYITAKVEEGVNENAYLVPQTALTRDPKGQAIVMLVGADNKIQRRIVNATSMRGPNWVIEGGLNTGDRVIVQGAEHLPPGTEVNPQIVDFQSLPGEQAALAELAAADEPLSVNPTLNEQPSAVDPNANQLPEKEAHSDVAVSQKQAVKPLKAQPVSAKESAKKQK